MSSRTGLRMFLVTSLCPSVFHRRMVLSEEQDRYDPGGRRASPPPSSGYTCRTHNGTF